MNNLLGPTQFTLYLAAPVEGTGTPFHHYDLLCPVASAAAHQITSVDPYRGIVTLAAVRSLDPQSRIPIAEPRRGFQIDQILRTRRFVVRIVRFQLEVVSGEEKK